MWTYDFKTIDFYVFGLSLIMKTLTQTMTRTKLTSKMIRQKNLIQDLQCFRSFFFL